MKESLIYFDGKMVPASQACVHLIAPAMQYAATVFEGLRAYWSARQRQLYIFRMEEHLRRLAYSIKLMRFDAPFTSEDIRAAILETIRANELKEDIHLRVFAYLDGPPVITATSPVRLAVTAGPFSKNEFVDKGMACVVSSWARLSDNASPPRLKATANYNSGRLAAIQAKVDGYDAPIMLTERGYVAEGPQANLVMVRDGKVVTPRITDGILESITRNTVIELLREEHGIETEERGIDRTELYAAEELFFCGSGWEIRPVASVDRLSVGDGGIGPVTRKVKESYFACVRGELPRSSPWLTPVW